ncbi:mechanosensitive ion channel family protein [Francisella sp. SYW-9]|uniref:mechanosensitive ion channel family protein n=1 Tax=Francisella sp. SYW-9 TaxID=2610888 RepID=UPI00168D2F82|nr:mechanosensitive ion channel domain-containing protein [Francisella sp. SYW-9]
MKNLKLISINNYFCIILFLLLGLCQQSYASSRSNDIDHKVKEINSYLLVIKDDKANSEIKIAYQRSKLLSYKHYLSKQMANLNSKLERVDSLLSFIQKKYQIKKFSGFINKQVEENSEFKAKLKNYTHRRASILNELILLKETKLNVEDALTHISNMRTYLRNQFRFEKNNVLWQWGNWISAKNSFIKNLAMISKDMLIFIFILGIYFLIKRFFSLKKILVENPRLQHKRNISKATIKFNSIYILMLSTIVYPLVILAIANYLNYIGNLSNNSIYVIDTILQVIVIYSAILFVLESFAKVVLSRSIKVTILVLYSIFGLIMYLFRSNLINFERGHFIAVMPKDDILVLVFFFMLLMLIPATIAFIMLSKPKIRSRETKLKVLVCTKYFIFISLVVSIFTMILGGYPNLGMSIGFDLYQTFFWGTYVYVFYKLLVLAVDLILCKKNKIILTRGLVENILGGFKRANLRYWVKNIMFILAILIFLILLPLSLNIQPEKLKDLWEIFAYHGISILGIKIIPAVTLLESLVLFVITLFVGKLTIIFCNRRVFPYTKMDHGSIEAAMSIIKYLFILIAVFIFIKCLGMSNTAITFIVSGLSVGLGFAMQDLIKNFFAGLIMLFERPVKIGDWVKVNKEIGVVKNISIRATEILTFDNNSLIVPNHVMVTDVVSNETLDKKVRLDLPIRLSYEDDFKKAVSICEKVIKADRRILLEPKPEYLLYDYGESSMILMVRAYCLRTMKIHILSDLRIKVLEEFNANNIRISLAKMDIYIKNDNKKDSQIM